MDFFKSDLFNKIASMLFLVSMIFLFSIVINRFHIMELLDTFEDKSFDLRQRISFQEKKQSRDSLVILTVDDPSLEILQEDYGRWPWKREVWADVTHYLEKLGVKQVGYDLMFVGHQSGQYASDMKLVKAFDSYDNAYTSMNFSSVKGSNKSFDYEAYEKGLLNIPERLSLHLEDKSDILYYSYPKYRRIMTEIIDSNANIGFINVNRDNDGVNRTVPLLVKYDLDNEFYPYLGFKMALDYLHKENGVDNKNLKINNKKELLLGDKKIKLNQYGEVYLNWYPNNTDAFKTVPLWKLVKSMKLEKKGMDPYEDVKALKDKVVFVGATAIALYDIKSVPVSEYMPGVYFHPTLFNNILDGNLITKLDIRVEWLLIVLLGSLVGLSVHKSQSPIVASTISLVFASIYIVVSVLMMKWYNVWIPLILPMIVAILSFTGMYIMKYVKKSRDFEYTYKLATTDGLTNLYNHRYFQDQLVSNIELYNRYNNDFSIVLIDIDFFKKFNDTYGHQAGDAVLKQVADRLKKLVRGTDIVARYGGEEMVIILTNTPVDEAYKAAQKVCNGIGTSPFKLSADLEVNVTISVGVATYPMHGKTPSELIGVADKGLYFAKENGRNQVGKVEGYEAVEG